MYGIFTYIYLKNQPNAGKYTIPASYRIVHEVWVGNIVKETISEKDGTT